MSLALVLLVFNWYLSIAFTDLESFTVTTHAHPDAYASTIDPVTITLWFKSNVYQYEWPDMDEATAYSAYKTSIPQFDVIRSTNCSFEAKMMIECDSDDALTFESVSFTTTSNVWYGIEDICFDSSIVSYDPELQIMDANCPPETKHYSGICVDNQFGYGEGCAPYKQIVYFNLSLPNQYIFNAQWANGIDVNPHTETCVPITNTTKSSTNTPTVPPTNVPTNQPFMTPTKIPTVPKTNVPTVPTDMPTNMPFMSPTVPPTNVPTVPPTNIPTNIPFMSPTYTPSSFPSNPTESPIHISTEKTTTPTLYPSTNPTHPPSKPPVSSATNSPTHHPLKSSTQTMFTTIRRTLTTLPYMDTEANEPEGSKKGSSGLIALYVVVAVLCCVVILLLCIILKKRNKDNEIEKSQREIEVEPDANVHQINQMKAIRTDRLRLRSLSSKSAEEAKDNEDTNTPIGYTKGDIHPGSNEVQDWLIAMELPQYYENFFVNGYEKLSFVEAIQNAQELSDIGIVKIGHQNVIMAEIKKLLKNNANDVNDNEGNNNEKEGYKQYPTPEKDHRRQTDDTQ